MFVLSYAFNQPSSRLRTTYNITCIFNAKSRNIYKCPYGSTFSSLCMLFWNFSHLIFCHQQNPCLTPMFPLSSQSLMYLSVFSFLWMPLPPPLFPFPHTRPSNGSGNASSPLIMRVVKSQAATHRGARGHHSGGMARMNERTKGTDYIAVSEWVSEQLLALPLLPSPFSSNFMPQSYSICGL